MTSHETESAHAPAWARRLAIAGPVFLALSSPLPATDSFSSAWPPGYLAAWATRRRDTP